MGKVGWAIVGLLTPTVAYAETDAQFCGRMRSEFGRVQARQVEAVERYRACVAGLTEKDFRLGLAGLRCEPDFGYLKEGSTVLTIAASTVAKACRRN